MYFSGTIPSMLICMITSVAIKRHTEKSIAAFRIAPSIPTQLLNLCSLIARRTPKSVSSATAISKIRMNELLDNKIKIFSIILIVLSLIFLQNKKDPLRSRSDFHIRLQQNKSSFPLFIFLLILFLISNHVMLLYFQIWLMQL